MIVGKSGPLDASGTLDPVAAGRRLIRTAFKGALGTLDHASGHPFTSLVLVATEPDGTPVFLISRLALHTQNLAKDARASLLIDGTGGLGDPMTGARITLTGHVRPTESATAKFRFLARHPSARTYADFSDFSMHAFDIACGHHIGGFGRIVDLERSQLLSTVTDARELTAAEASIVDHMNDDHADAVELYATEFGKCGPGDWRMSGIDPEGIDLLHCSNGVRIEFPKRVRTPSEARLALVDLAKLARERRSAATSK